MRFLSTFILYLLSPKPKVPVSSDSKVVTYLLSPTIQNSNLTPKVIVLRVLIFDQFLVVVVLGTHFVVTFLYFKVI